MENDGEKVDEVGVTAMIQSADKLWKDGLHDKSVRTYERALSIARGKGDRATEGMICLGLGFAMMNLEEEGSIERALPYMQISLRIAKEDGQTRQIEFLEHLIEKASRKSNENKGDSSKRPEDGNVESEKNRGSFATKVASEAFAKAVGADPDRQKKSGCCRQEKDGSEKAGARRAVKRVSEEAILKTLWRAATEISGHSRDERKMPDVDVVATLTWDRFGIRDIKGDRATRFVDLVSRKLGGFDLPSSETLLRDRKSIGALASYIAENCPVHGHCSTCPSRETCEAHDEASSAKCVDIEDVLCEETCTKKRADVRKGEA